MKNLLLPLILLLFQFSFAQNKQILTDQDRLNNCIKLHTNSFTYNNVQPIGKGWEILEDLFAQNQFVAWGEYHNSPKLSELTAYAMASASKHGYQNLCVETSPFVATELMRISRTANPADTLAKIYKDGYPGIGTFPFFHTSEDTGMLLAAHQFNYSIWGIDQEFQMGFSYGMKKIFNAQHQNIKLKYKTVYDSLQAKWWYPETKLIDSFKYVVKQPKFRTLLDDIKRSKEIYRYGDNEGRATLMKKNFFNYYNSAKKPKVFFKMGSNHLAKGMNLQTNLYDIGNAIYELAQRNGSGFANVYLMVRYTIEKGVLIDDLNTNENENPKVFSQLYDKDKWVVVDIRSLRSRLKYDASLTRDTYAIIEKYDYIMVSPEILKL